MVPPAEDIPEGYFIGSAKEVLEHALACIDNGEHDLAENIVHCVLARLPGAPEGTKGISLFLVPKRR